MTFNILFPMSPRFKMDALPQASLLLGIIPALVIMYVGLKGYEGHYKDKTIFLTFIVGIVAGVIAALIELVTVNAGIAFIVLFPALEQLLKTMILNIGRLQRKKETTIYGLSLGLGFGSIFTPVSMIFANVKMGEIISVALVIIGSLGIILVHGATGIIIGYGVYDGKLSKYFAFAFLLSVPVTLWFFLTIFFKVEYLQIGLIAYGLIVYWYALKRIMPQILPKSKLRKRSKKIGTNIK
jgi:hypothetical protein